MMAIDVVEGVICREVLFLYSSRGRHTRYWRDWSSDVCSSDLLQRRAVVLVADGLPAVFQADDAQPAVGQGQPRLFEEAVFIRPAVDDGLGHGPDGAGGRSGERRVGERCRSRWSADHLKKRKCD